MSKKISSKICCVSSYIASRGFYEMQHSARTIHSIEENKLIIIKKIASNFNKKARKSKNICKV
jgi:hypothetical protein